MNNKVLYIMLNSFQHLHNRIIRSRNRFGMTIAMLLFIVNSFAQQSADVEMADDMRASGKIYVVVAVLSIVFLGIVVYLVSLDRKISRLEKEINQNKDNKL